jgi:putative addiction module CopG family antidote
MTVTTTSVQIAPDLAAKIKQKIATGTYPDADAVIRDALDLLEERDRKHAWLLEALAEGERGESHEFTPERMAMIRQRARENARNGKPISDAVTP